MSIHFPRDVQDDVEGHCFSRLDVEVGGFLVGTIDGDGTHIKAAHAAVAAQSGQTNLTFTHEVWQEVLQTLESEFPGQAIVGWYHSHPGFGVFLSDYDIFIQENFFGSPGQVALVVDPLAGTYGFLTADGGAFVEEKSGKTLRVPEARAGADKVDALEGRDDQDRPRTRWVPLVVIAIVVGILSAAAGWFVGSVQGQGRATDSAQARAADLESQVLELQQQLDAATSGPSPAATPTSTPTPIPTPMPTPNPTPEPDPVGPQPGETVAITIEHVVSDRETLWSIASAYLGSGPRFVEILAVNPGLRPKNLQEGQVILVPIEGSLLSSGGGE